jgi:hypothetical protein
MSDYWSASVIADLRLGDSEHQCLYRPGQIVYYTPRLDLEAGRIAECCRSYSRGCEYLVELTTGDRVWAHDDQLMGATTQGESGPHRQEGVTAADPDPY